MRLMPGFYRLSCYRNYSHVNANAANALAGNATLPFDGDMQFSVGQCSRAGKKERNDDSIGIRIPTGSLQSTKGVVAVVADGVSAAEAGKEAAETCVQNFLSDYYCTPESWSVKKSAQQVLTALNRWLYGQGQHFIEAQRGYVSTFSAVVFKSRTAHVFHVGDSRVYRYRDGELEQLTQDHATRISREQSYLTRAMGLDMRLDIDYRTVELRIGDVFILTTDGVHDFVRPLDIASVINSSVARQQDAQLEQACERLVFDALANNSGDNLSVQILRVDSLPFENPDDVYRRLTALPFPPALSRGMQLDGLTIERELHASSRSQLYIVRDAETGVRCLMKTPSINFSDDAAYIERFIMESWIGARITSPYVARIVDYDRPKTFLYYLLEYIDGMTLGRWMKENPKPAMQEVIYFTDQIAKALRAFHRRETLHQDLKPDNIMIDKTGVIRVIDFGSCLVAGVAEIALPIQREIALGTEQYAAPEYRVGVAPSARSDQFSLAVIVYEMLTGKLPYDGKYVSRRGRVGRDEPRYVPASEINPMVPIWFDAAVQKALSLDPGQRYPEIDEFITDLKRPNVSLVSARKGAWLTRTPTHVWQILVLLLLITNIVTLLWFLR
jgi:serine/threonine protein phosphatase PrpC